MSADAMQPPPPIMACLAQEHRHMSALATLLRQRAQTSKALRHGDYCLMRDVVGYLHDFPDRVHHPTEDALFRRLARRRPDLEGELKEIRVDHSKLADETGRLLELLDNEGAEAGDEYEQSVRSQVLAFADHQGRHMAHERRSLFQAALADLQAADWKTLSQRRDLHRDPLFGEWVDRRHRRLFEFLLDPGANVPRATASAIENQERLIVAFDTLERGAAAGIAALGRAAGEVGEEARGLIAGSRRPASLAGLLACPWRFGFFMVRTASGCSGSLAEIFTATVQETWDALRPRPRQ